MPDEEVEEPEEDDEPDESEPPLELLPELELPESPDPDGLDELAPSDPDLLLA